MAINLKNLRPILLIVCWLPLLWLLVDISFARLGSNPIQAVHIRLGDWALRFLCLTLAVTPLQTITNWRGLADYRRMFGLFSFAYASLHVFSYLILDHFLAWRIIAIDIIQSSYLWFGLIAYLILFLLAVSTPNRAKKLLGKNWKKVHRFIYTAAGAAVLHYFWQLKGNLAEPLFYSVAITILLGFRLAVSIKTRAINRLLLPTGRKKDS